MRREGTLHSIELRPAAKPDRLALLRLERLHSSERRHSRDIAVPRARTRDLALTRGGDEGAELGVEGGREALAPVRVNTAHEDAVGLDHDLAAVGQAHCAALADDLAANVIAIGDMNRRLDRNKRA